ncbi:hypothetical protein RS130_10795 [Paraglaciecola aquimarina]|uniref:Uncharacterized protein n=1 Tax=Paraglaciecola aquimarina TaxID=1235557 RepID=A0ABU3SWJ5_9ALTE|nr:hypothetical protein [Paraglaciecola aquimarina]MDU0354353.1 hypothetical protein [Paraglaciecola aquimarina]
MLLALTGCNTPDYEYEAKPNTSAPTHGGDIYVSLPEKWELKVVDLLGTTTSGNTTNDTVAKDADKDYLTVKDVVLTASIKDASGNVITSDVELAAGAAVIDGNFINYRPVLAEAQVDSDQVLSIVAEYNISDGEHSIPRKVTVELVGEDFAPQFDGGLSAGGTLDNDTVRLELLTGVTDQDAQDAVLSASNMVANTDNPFELAFSIVDIEKVNDMGTPDDTEDDVTYTTQQVEFDVTSISDELTRGLSYQFNYTYDVNDHNHAIQRDLSFTLLAVKDIPGSPKVDEYFTDEIVPETSGITVVDLKQGIVEREGDAIVISDVKVNDKTSDLDFGILDIDEADGTVTIDSHAFFTEAKVGKTFKAAEVTYTVADDKGNVTDGKRTLSIMVQGEQVNLGAVVAPNVDLEDPLYVGQFTQANLATFTFGYAHNWNCGGDQGIFISEDAARTGNYGLLLDGAICYIGLDDIATLETGQKYAFSYGLRNPEDLPSSANPFSPVWVTNTTLNNKFWSASRPAVQPAGEWKEIVTLVGTHMSAWAGYEGSMLQWDIGQYDPRAVHHFDDISVVEYGAIDTSVHDLLVDNVGLFENNEAIASNAGLVEIRDDAGDKKLFVDVGAESSVTVSLPIKAGAIKPNARYALSIEGQLINHAALGLADSVGYSVSLSNGVDSIAASNNPITWAANVMPQDVIISENYGRSAEIDWSQETMTLDITFTQVNAQYYINNLRLIAIPN